MSTTITCIFSNLKYNCKMNIASLKSLDKTDMTRWGFRILFFLFVWLYLGIYKGDYLFKLQDSFYFIYDHQFVEHLMTKKSWMIILMARFILQFSYYPLLGAAIVAALISGIELIASKLFNIGKRWFFIGFLPCLALLVAFCSVTYEMYDQFETSFPAAVIIGFYFALLLFFLYRKLENSIIATVILTIATSISFIWMGPCAFVALLMIGTDALFRKRFIPGAITLTLGALCCYFCMNYASYHVMPAFWSYSLFHPWPTPFFHGIFITNLVAHVVATLVLTTHTFYKEKQIPERFELSANIAMSLLFVLITIYLCRFPFVLKEELRLQHLAHKSEWKQMVKEMGEMEASSRVIAAYRVIALNNTEQLSKKVFNYHYSYSHPGFYKYNEEMIYYPELMLYNSFPQVSYRWCMEVLTDGQISMGILRIMALCAFTNEEYDLARRYLNLLKSSLFYDTWAEEMLSCLDKPDKYIEKYPELKNVIKGRPFIETTGIVRGAVTIYDRYPALPNISAERKLLTLLYRRNLDQFQKEVRLSPFMKKGLPRCMQQGLILKAFMTQDNSILRNFPIDKSEFDYVERFINYYKVHHDDDDLAIQMKEKFGYSYCHYFTFGVGAKPINKKGTK